MTSISPTGDLPSPRVGAATTTLNGKIYMFSGRGGEAMAPIDEQGQLWVLDPLSNSWSFLTPASPVHPQPRSYHCMTNNGQDTVYVHAGCPETGRLSDLWAFNLPRSEWVQLTSAPDPPRGGTSAAFSDGRIYRMNGFDGNTEQGGSLDVYQLVTDTWTSLRFVADGKSGPGARSVSALVTGRIEGRECLITLFGESDPSSLGHQGAGKMLSDAWLYRIDNGLWSQIAMDAASAPEARGWFDADVAKVDGKDCVVIVGGLGESNERLDDAWLLAL